MPRTENGFMYIVLPMLSNGNIYQNRIKVSLGLGSGASSPFVMANYEKTFEMETVTPKNSNEEKELFLIEFTVKLSSERINGVYPVAVNISGYDDSGTPIDCSYTIYVTIIDGKSNQVTQPAPEVATAEPVVYISNSVVQPDKVMAGEEFTLTVTLKNSLATKSVKNMLVKIDTGNLHINLLENTNVFQVDKIPAGGETELTFRLGSDASIPAGKYNLNFTFNYDSSKTLNLSSSGSTIVEIHQPANMELVMPRFAQSVTVGETIPLSLQVMNMGRDPMYNVRCTVSGFGFAPSNTGYIGTMDAGSSATTETVMLSIGLLACAVSLIREKRAAETAKTRSEMAMLLLAGMTADAVDHVFPLRITWTCTACVLAAALISVIMGTFSLIAVGINIFAVGVIEVAVLILFGIE